MIAHIRVDGAFQMILGTTGAVHQQGRAIASWVSDRVGFPLPGLNTDDMLSPVDEEDAILTWIADHPEVIRQHEGEWLAFDGTTIVAHEQSIVDSLAIAREAGFPDPVMFPVHPAGTRM